MLKNNLNDLCINTPKVNLLYEDECGKLMSVSAIFGYYSRSHDSTDQLVERALKLQADGRESYKNFIEKYVVSEGHDSLSDHPPIFVYVENVSNFAVKVLEHSDLAVKKLVLGVMEKSTRFINFDREDCRKVFFNSFISKHKSLQDKIDKLFNKRMDMYKKMDGFYKDFIRIINENLEEDEKKVQVKLALDSSRYELPYGLKTTCGLTFNGRSIKKKLVELLISPFDEIRLIGEQLLEITSNKFPYLIKKEEILLEVEAELKFKELELEKTYRRYMGGEIREKGKAKNLIKDIKVEEMKILMENKDDLDFFGEAIDPIYVYSRRNAPDAHIIKKSYTHAPTFNPSIEDKDTEDILYSISKIKKEERFSNCKLNIAYEKLQKSLIYDELKAYEVLSDLGAFRDIHRNRGVSVSFEQTVGIHLKDLGFGDRFIINPIFTSYFILDLITSKNHDIRELGERLERLKERFEREFYTELKDLFKEICEKFEEERSNYSENEYSFVIKRYYLIKEVLSYLVPLGISIKYYIQGTTSSLIEFVNNRTQKGAHASYKRVAYSIGFDLAQFYDVEFSTMFPNRKFPEGNYFSDVIDRVCDNDNQNREKVKACIKKIGEICKKYNLDDSEERDGKIEN